MTQDTEPPDGTPGSGSPGRPEPELALARDIADSRLRAASPLEVFRVALARLTPLVGASFASVFLRAEAQPSLLRLVCAHNWPQAAARHLSEVRIREGRGPTGRAVAGNRPVEVADVFEDPALRDWWEPADELGFVSMVALPIATGDRVLGALSFYFAERREFNDRDRSLFRVAAHQLASTAARAGRAPARDGDGQ